MAKAHSLQAAADVAQSREDTAVKALADSQQRLVEQQNRVQMLIMFRGEYAVQFQQESGGGISARQFQNYAAFLNSLDHGIAQSQQQLEGLERELQRKQQAWVQTHAKTKGLEEVIDRDRKTQLRREDQREQRDNDERNLRNPGSRQRPTGGDGG
ncbi:MAG: flagellar export protein FliJ [Candidatus Contendobacter sp.]|jgi:flagellar FliJ protein|nr:flagellar export protein FliJ [Candidatus Contendobacter sp.]